MYNLFLDDERNPEDVTWGDIDYSKFTWTIVRNWADFTWSVIDCQPKMISFDNDIGEAKEGYDCLKWLIDYCIDNELDIPIVYVHSKNSVAKENMLNYLNCWEKFNGKKEK